MVAISRTAAAGIAVLSALNHVAATSAPAGDASSNEARDVLNESSEGIALDARDFGDDVPETRDLMEGADPELNKRLLPLIGLGAKLGAKAGAKAAAKKAAKKAARKGAKKGGSEGAKHQHQKNQNKKNNKKKGRRSFDDDELSERDYEDELYERDFDDDYFLEARDILGDVSDSFETRAVRPKGGMSRASRHKGSPSMRPGAGRGRPSRGGSRFSSFLKPMRKGASPRSFDDAAEFFEE